MQSASGGGGSGGGVRVGGVGGGAAASLSGPVSLANPTLKQRPLFRSSADGGANGSGANGGAGLPSEEREEMSQGLQYSVAKVQHDNPWLEAQLRAEEEAGTTAAEIAEEAQDARRRGGGYDGGGGGGYGDEPPCAAELDEEAQLARALAASEISSADDDVQRQRKKADAAYRAAVAAGAVPPGLAADGDGDGDGANEGEPKALSMHQPWASLLVHGIKRVEGRSWPTPHRGRLWIASTAQPPNELEVAAVEQQYTTLYGDAVAFPASYPSAALLGCVDVVDCVTNAQYTAATPDPARREENGSDFLFVCTKPRTLAIPIRISGDHKIWRLDPAIANSARASLRPAPAVRDARPPAGGPPPGLASQPAPRDCIFFYGHSRGEYAPFSQFYGPVAFTDDDGHAYSCAEQYMMAAKAKAMGDGGTLAQILACGYDPPAIKALGRQVTPYDEATWAAVRLERVTHGNFLKFSQNAQLRVLLLGTGEKTLVEAAPTDRVWGIGIGVDEARRGARWNGENLLGKALMGARARIRAAE